MGSMSGNIHDIEMAVLLVPQHPGLYSSSALFLNIHSPISWGFQDELLLSHCAAKGVDSKKGSFSLTRPRLVLCPRKKSSGRGR